LQRQAFLRIARTDAGRIEVLQVAQGDAEFFEQGFAQLVVFADQQVDQLVQRLRQVAVVTQGFDQEADQRPFAVGQLGHRHLRAEVLAQGIRRGLGFAAVGVVVVGVALAVAAGEVHAPAFVVAAARFLALLALIGSAADGLRCRLRIARGPRLNSGRFSPGSSRSSRGFSCRAWSISAFNSSVDNCRSLIDCCNCGVSARCCESLSWSPCLIFLVLEPTF
jgi:hypothetical protein